MVLDNLGHHIFRPFRTVRATGRLLQQVAIGNQTLARPTPDTADAGTHRRLGDALGALNQCAAASSDVRDQRFGWPLELWQSSLHQLAQHHQVHVVQITDPLDSELPPAGVYNIANGDQTVSFIPAILRFERVTPPTTTQCPDRKLCRHPALTFRKLSTADTDWDTLAWMSAARYIALRTRR